MNTKHILQITSGLKTIIEHEPGTIRALVAQEALEYHDPIAFFNDLLSHGCASGMVTSLIYYKDTHAFFDAHYDEIEDLRLDFIHQTGESLAVTGDMKNWYAWFSFEETARMMVDELSI